MRALHVPAAGAEIQLGEVSTPQVAEGTVLVRVKAATLAAGKANGKLVVKVEG